MDEQQPQNEVQEEQNVQMESTPLPEPPSHKKLIIGIVVVFVLVVVGMAGAYFVLQPKSESAEEENTEITNTIKVPGPLDDITFEEDQAMNDAVEEPNVPDGWKTYMNEKYGFEFQYPVEFITYIGFSEGEPIEANSVSEKFQIARNNTLLRNGESLTIGIEVITNTSLTSKEWLNENKENYSDIDEIKFIRDSKFAGKNVVELEGGGNIGSVYKLYVISANDYLLVITQANDQSLEKILSTFKFIEPQASVDTSIQQILKEKVNWLPRKYEPIVSLNVENKVFTTKTIAGCRQGDCVKEFKVTSDTIIKYKDESLSFDDLSIDDITFVRAKLDEENKFIAELIIISNDSRNSVVIISDIDKTNNTITTVSLSKYPNGEKVYQFKPETIVLNFKDLDTSYWNASDEKNISDLSIGDTAFIFEIGFGYHEILQEGQFTTIQVEVVDNNICNLFTGNQTKTNNCLQALKDFNKKPF